MGKTVAKPQEDKSLLITCQICVKRVTLPNIINFNHKNRYADRQHPSFCTDCIIRYIQVKLKENVSHIRCPAMSCQHFLKPLSFRGKLTRQEFEKWCDLLCESTVLRMVDKVYCPNIKCGEVILNECGDKNLKRCVCSYCKKPLCFQCKIPWHGARSTKCIEEWQHDIAFEHVLKREKWQRCPVCRHCIERISGCNRVRCRCGNTFCYKCGQQRCVCGLINNPFHLALILAIIIVTMCLFLKICLSVIFSWVSGRGRALF